MAVLVLTAASFGGNVMHPLEYTESTSVPDSSVTVSAEPEHTESDTKEEMPTVGLLTACGWTERQLAQALKGNLPQYAADFLAAEQTYGVNAVFLAAIAAQESGWGRSELAVNRNNLFGIKGDGSYKRFSSREACIQYVARHLSVNYLSPDGRYFHGYEVKDVCVCYCGSDSWTRQVERIMRDLNASCAAFAEQEEQNATMHIFKPQKVVKVRGKEPKKEELYWIPVYA